MTNSNLLWLFGGFVIGAVGMHLMSSGTASAHPPYSAQEAAIYDECLSMTGNTAACAAKIRNMERETAMNGGSDGWLNQLPVKPGSSPPPPSLQSIGLLETTGFKLIGDKAWINGRAMQIDLDDGQSHANGGGGIGVEITVDGASDQVFKQCQSAINALPSKYISPESQEIIISGPGRYKPIEAKGYLHGLYVFELFHPTQCEVVKLKNPV